MQYCSADIKSVQLIEGYKLYLRFEDGHEGVVDISEIFPFDVVFKPLKDKDYFKSVFINDELGTITWNNGADLSPALLYQNIKK